MDADVSGSDGEEHEEAVIWCSAPSGTPAPSHRRCVLHVDIDCFYAQVEMLERPELRERPLGIQQKNIVVTCNYPARARGVTKCCTVAEAVARCPELVLVNGSDLTRYRRASAQIHRLLSRFSSRVQKLGFDENFLDVTEAVAERLAADYVAADVAGYVFAERGQRCDCGCDERLTVGSHVAVEVRRALRTELGISSCAGIGFNKLLAKLACGAHKPDQQTVVFAAGVDRLLLDAGPVRCLPGIGSRTSELLTKAGILTVEDARACDLPRLASTLGSRSTAETVRALAFGADESDVKVSSAALSLGVEDGFRRVDSLEECEAKMRELVRRVLLLLREDGRTPSVMRVSLRRYHKDNYYRFRESRQAKVSPSVFSRCVSQPEDTETTERMLSGAMALLKKMVSDKPFHLTLLGLAVTGFPEQNQPAQYDISKFIQKAVGSPTGDKPHSGTEGGAAAPAGVDQSVWSGLPPDIRAELQQQHMGPGRKRRQQSIGNFFASCGSAAKRRPTADYREAGDHQLEDTIMNARTECGLEHAPADPAGNSVPSAEDEEDPDDPGSPVVSRSVVVRAASCSWQSLSTKHEQVSEKMLQPASPASAGREQRLSTTDALDNPSSAVSRDAADLSYSGSSTTAKQPHSFFARAAARLKASLSVKQDGETPINRTESSEVSSAYEHSLVENVKCNTNPERDPTAADRVTEQPWDAEVFSELPPDIQFELKMAQRQRAPEKPRQTATAAQKKRTPSSSGSGSIMHFFKR